MDQSIIESNQFNIIKKPAETEAKKPSLMRSIIELVQQAENDQIRADNYLKTVPS